jgi:hypothetical protein
MGHYWFEVFANQGSAIRMAKFYVQSGSVRSVVDSVDLDRAALWAVNDVMDHALSLDGESLEGDLYNESDCETEDFGSAKLDATKPIAESRYLGATVRISEIGFDRDDAMVVDTLEVFRHWYELFQAVSVLSAKFSSK